MPSIPQVNYTSLYVSGDTPQQAISRLTGYAQVVFPDGFDDGFTSDVNGFSFNNTFGIYKNFCLGFLGSGPSQVLIRMKPLSATAAQIATVPSQAAGGTNQLYLARFGNGPSDMRQTATYGVTFQSTDQAITNLNPPQAAHPLNYNGIFIYYGLNAFMQNCQILGFEGDNGAPPGETFPLNNYNGTNTTIDNIFQDGKGIGASGYGNNTGTGGVCSNSTFQNNAYGAGITHYKEANPTYINCKLFNNHGAGINCEKVTGTITVTDCQFSGNGHNMIVDTDGASAVVNITDPVWDGQSTGTKFQVLCHAKYNYPPPDVTPNQQKASDIHLFLAGVERPDMLQIVTS